MQHSQQRRSWRRLAVLLVLQLGALGGAAAWGASRAIDLLGAEASRLAIHVVLERSTFRLKLSARLDLGTST